MVSVFRSIFRVILILVFMFITLKTFGIFPPGAEAAIRYGSFIGRSGSGNSYRNNYGNRVVYKSFGSSFSSRRKSEENLQEVDQKRLYYEKKMAEWREKNKELLSNNRTSEAEAENGDDEVSAATISASQIDGHAHQSQSDQSKSAGDRELNPGSKIGGNEENQSQSSKKTRINSSSDFDYQDPDQDEAEDGIDQYNYENYVDPTTTTTTTTEKHPNSNFSTADEGQGQSSTNDSSGSSTITDEPSQIVTVKTSVKPDRRIYGYRYGRVKVVKLLRGKFSNVC